MNSFKIDVGFGPEDRCGDFHMVANVVPEDELGDFFEGDGDTVRGAFNKSPYECEIGDEGGTYKKMPEYLGVLKLIDEELGAGYVTHELTHALQWYSEVMPFTDLFANEEIEEIVAWEFGNWHRQFWNQWREIKGGREGGE